MRHALLPLAVEGGGKRRDLVGAEHAAQHGVALGAVLRVRGCDGLGVDQSLTCSGVPGRAATLVGGCENAARKSPRKVSIPLNGPAEGGTAPAA